MHTKFWPENLKRPLGRHRCGREDSIKIDLKEMRCELDSSGSGQDLADLLMWE